MSRLPYKSRADARLDRGQVFGGDDAPRFWNVRQGTSKARVKAPDFAGARERAQQIGFARPDSIVLDEVAK